MPALWKQLVWAATALITVLSGAFLPSYPLGEPAPLWSHFLNGLRIGWILFVVGTIALWGVRYFYSSKSYLRKMQERKERP